MQPEANSNTDNAMWVAASNNYNLTAPACSTGPPSHVVTGWGGRRSCTIELELDVSLPGGYHTPLLFVDKLLLLLLVM